MKELMFVIKIFILTLIVVVVLQVPYKGQTLEARAEFIFGRSETISWIRSSTHQVTNLIKNKYSDFRKDKKQNENVPDLNNVSEIDFEN